jgi:Ca2+-binding RTX toxin-like protein
MARILGTQFSDFLSGTAFNDQMYGFNGDDYIRTSAGSDYIDGGANFDTVDYTNLGRSITLLPRGVLTKTGLGTDQLVNVERIIAPVGQINTINGSSSTGIASFTINLASNSLRINNTSVGALSFTVQNFSNVIGTANSDNITGNSFTNIFSGLNGNDTLSGGVGNDGLSGGNGNDILVGNSGGDVIVGDAGVDVLLGTDNVSRGAGEFDQLTGGFDTDGFVLGDRNGGYYKSANNIDRAKITDFSSNDVIYVGVGEFYATQRTSQGFNLFAATNRGYDLVAEVRTTSFIGLPNGGFRLASGQRFGSFVGA